MTNGIVIICVPREISLVYLKNLFTICVDFFNTVG